MARNENPPFQVGTTFFTERGDTPTLTEILNLLGKTWLFEDIDYAAAYSTSGSAKPARSNRYVRRMLVRNNSGGTIAPKLLCKLDVTNAGGLLIATTGVATAFADIGYPVDEFLAASVAANDIFWVTVEGPAKITTAAAGDTNITRGDYLATAAGGKVVGIDPTVVTADLFNSIQNCPGYALESVNAINTVFLMNVLPRGIA